MTMQNENEKKYKPPIIPQFSFTFPADISPLD